MERRALIGSAVLLVAVAGGAAWWLRSDGAMAGIAQAPHVERLIPDGTRVRVEVLNASDVRGLARRATLVLRDAGFDVVRFAGDAARHDSTVVIDRTGHTQWARAAARALGESGTRVEARPDSGRYVDLTILLGARWRPPPQPFHP